MPYRHQQVRDLAWLLASPPLLGPGIAGLPVPPEAWLASCAEQAQPWLLMLDEEPADLLAWTDHQLRRSSSSPGRLGHYAETLLGFWAGRQPGLTLLGTRVPVEEGGTSRGDLDLLFSCPQRQARIHWEVAVKFYLGAPATASWAQWLGPDASECLADKLERIRTHQLPLGAAAQATASAGTLPMHSEALVKGWLFYPCSDSGGHGVPPAGAHPGHPRGWWLRHGGQDLPRSSRASRFLILPRLAWLSPARVPIGAPGVLAAGEASKALAHHFATSHHSVLIAEVRHDQEGWWSEVARGIVVARHWPERPGAP